MDHLNLIVLNENTKGEDPPHLAVQIQIEINNELLGTDFPLNIKELLASTKKEGRYNFWTCFCGIPHCAGIVVDIEVKYKNNQIIWQVKELPFMKDKVFEFEKVLYQDTINTAFTEFELAIQNNKRNGLDFEIYPDIKFTGIDKLLKPI